MRALSAAPRGYALHRCRRSPANHLRPCDRRQRVGLYRPVIDDILADLTGGDNVSFEQENIVHRLLPIKEHLDALERSSQDLVGSLSRVVESEEDSACRS